MSMPLDRLQTTQRKSPTLTLGGRHFVYTRFRGIVTQERQRVQSYHVVTRLAFKLRNLRLELN